jgi:hypothetical protein
VPYALRHFLWICHPNRGKRQRCKVAGSIADEIVGFDLISPASNRKKF